MARSGTFILLLLHAGCNNPCQRLCFRMKTFAEDCGFTIPAAELDACVNEQKSPLIREDKISQIYGSMQVGQSETGSQTLNQSLGQLVLAGKVAEKDAMARSQDPRELAKIIEDASGKRQARSGFRGR